LVEQPIRNRQVTGSSPVVGSTTRLAEAQFLAVSTSANPQYFLNRWIATISTRDAQAKAYLVWMFAVFLLGLTLVALAPIFLVTGL
jgi:hypothetical protein